jgi:hypothetical protein
MNSTTPIMPSALRIPVAALTARSISQLPLGQGNPNQPDQIPLLQ